MIMDKVRLTDLTYDEMEAFVTSNGLPKFRARQIFDWVLCGEPIENMTNLSKDLRLKLSDIATLGVPKIVNFLQSNLDETRKFLFAMDDGVLVESVLMKYKYGWSVCISSQAGCRMGCKFCASSDIPFSRSLSCGEILGQIIAINKHENIKISHIVIMGIGEPMDNYENIVKFLRIVSSPEGLNISQRKISISTCGVVPKIYEFANENFQVTLSISLHNPFDEERSLIMPVNKAYPLDDLFKACRFYAEKSGRRITFEYALISGVNDQDRHADELAKRLSGMLCHVNLIPVNSVEGKDFTRPEKKNIERFTAALEKKGLSVTVRRELGRDISAACGQLRKQTIESVDNNT